ncbi:MAG: nucleotide exchange factor GrpE [Ignavibacteriaceae bacterium]|nr:nucleotide exchange factor GrpE [Ignavibacteriaceae bacterium]
MAQKEKNKDTKPKENGDNDENENTNNLSIEESNHEKIQVLENEVSELKDKVLRKSAEFENYKRRTENDQLSLLTYAAESFIVKLLPIIDDFERSIKHIENTDEIDSLKEGMTLIYDKFIKLLDEQGVKKIESKGKPFDVNYHEAILQQKAENVPPHTVLDEIECGYMYKDKVIRHAKVIVSEDN